MASSVKIFSQWALYLPGIQRPYPQDKSGQRVPIHKAKVVKESLSTRRKWSKSPYPQGESGQRVPIHKAKVVKESLSTRRKWSKSPYPQGESGQRVPIHKAKVVKESLSTRRKWLRITCCRTIAMSYHGPHTPRTSTQ